MPMGINFVVRVNATHFYLFAQGRPAADPEGEEELGEVEAAVGVEVEEGEELAGQGAAGGRGQVGGQEQGVVGLELAGGDQARRTLAQEVGVPAGDLLPGESCGERWHDLGDTSVWKISIQKVEK